MDLCGAVSCCILVVSFWYSVNIVCVKDGVAVPCVSAVAERLWDVWDVMSYMWVAGQDIWDAWPGVWWWIELFTH